MLNRHSVIPDLTPKRTFAYFAIAFVTAVAFLWLRTLEPQRVGDGMEYYAMFLAWKETFRPWMTVASYASYQELFQSNQILGMMPASWLSESFPSLRLGVTSDFNHFWFYSLLAVVFEKLSHLLGLSPSPHGSFLFLHFLLLSATAMVAYHLYGKRGLVAFVLMTVFSPMWWFSDKVHTELFTYCVTLMGVMFLFSNRYLMSAFLIALAATQNPSFALIAFVPFLYRFTLERRKPFTLFEVCLVVGTALAVLAHPIYYFFRFGVITPQLLAGGATLGGNLSTFYIWILDPDLGLLPNWPLGVLLIGLAVIFRIAATRSVPLGGDKWFYGFLAIFCLVNFYAHSSTTNLNSGATPGLARYSLWYLPAFFPLVLYAVRAFPGQRMLAYPLGAVILLIGAASVVSNNPKHHEQYSTPTWLSNAIQARLPGLYTPPFEVFVERYSGMGEAVNIAKRRGVLGPDCHKLALFGGDGLGSVIIPAHCHMDPAKFQAMANTIPVTAESRFVDLNQDQYSQVLMRLEPARYPVGLAGNGNFSLASGWYDLEPWGVWSKGKIAKLSLPCNSTQYYFGKDVLNLAVELSGFGSQSISITQGSDVLFEGKVDAIKSIPLALKVGQCSDRELEIVVNIPHAQSPAKLGVSSDPRRLGVGFAGFTLQP